LAGALGFVALKFTKQHLLSEPSHTEFLTTIIGLVAASLVTAVTIVLALRLRERTQAPTMSAISAMANERLFERRFVERLYDLGIPFQMQHQPGRPDLLISEPTGKLAIELKAR